MTVAVPKKMSAKQKELLKEFAYAGGETWVGEPKSAEQPVASSKTQDKPKEKKSFWSKLKKDIKEDL